MPQGNKSLTQFKGSYSRKLAEHYSLTSDMFTYQMRSYTVPSKKKHKEKKITHQNIEWYIDQITYFHFGRYVFNQNNITIEYRYDTDLIKYSKGEFIDYYGDDDYIIHWYQAPENILQVDNVVYEKKYDTDLLSYTKQEFIEHYGIDNYLVHWTLAPYNITGEDENEIEERYGEDLLSYTKQEFINHHGIDNYLVYWQHAPTYLIQDTDYSPI